MRQDTSEDDYHSPGEYEVPRMLAPMGSIGTESSEKFKLNLRQIPQIPRPLKTKFQSEHPKVKKLQSIIKLPTSH